MGGRGSSSGVSVKGKKYGTEYKSLLKSGNIKFVQINEGSVTAPMETMTRGRVYVTLTNGDNPTPKFISYYDNENKRVKQIDLDKPHKGVSPHTHHGYEHNELDSSKGFANLTVEERKIVERVYEVWEKHKNSK